ncbi:IS110 family transposase [Ornithinimicrobium flavum]|uniref:IS110 family transposase n=1 Tax=Ornithinimicrobium flavum TaxID=1288636 RepID=UPI00107030FF|nr:IS110 family transposase [Ornithinimicrobium flavum]
MFTERTSVGLDVHARSVAAAAIDGVTGEVFKARLVPDQQVVLEWLGGLPGPVATAYEAGPTGYGLARALRAAGVRCEVVAPSKLARPSGDRVKTDARDAMHLARLLRLDEYTPVRVPTEAQESARDLVRAREAARGDLMRARHRVSKLLLRHGIVYSGGAAWTAKHDAWLLGQRFELPGTRTAFEDAYESAVLASGRRDRLDEQVAVLATEGEYVPVASRLACLRGISTLTSVALAVEIGDWDRFTGSSIGAYLGLVPTESSSGTRRSQGSITKTGNTHVRRLLVEAAWHHRKPYRPTAILRRRWERATPAAVARAQAGNHRLHRRWVGYAERRKRPVLANVAVARELAGWCWSLAVLPDQ